MSLVFQSTLPLRGATSQTPSAPTKPRDFNPHSPCGERRLSGCVWLRPRYFNPHSPCGERPWVLIVETTPLGISIHTPLAGSDAFRCLKPCLIVYFNPHSPCGERPIGCDTVKEYQYFNPHSPCGERQSSLINIRISSTFQSTLPLRGATRLDGARGRSQSISIHTPLAGSDPPRNRSLRSALYFNPHSPCGERRP